MTRISRLYPRLSAEHLATAEALFAKLLAALDERQVRGLGSKRLP